jgi:hypothetical protein
MNPVIASKIFHDRISRPDVFQQSTLYFRMVLANIRQSFTDSVTGVTSPECVRPQLPILAHVLGKRAILGDQLGQLFKSNAVEQTGSRLVSNNNMSTPGNSSSEPLELLRNQTLTSNSTALTPKLPVPVVIEWGKAEKLHDNFA